MSLRKSLRSELEAPPELRAFGTGWAAGVLAFAFSLGALCLVLLMRQPKLFGMPELAVLQNMAWLKPALFATMIIGFLLACISMVLRPQKLLGVLSVAIILLASLWASLPQLGDLTGGRSIYFGLDFFIINVIFGGILFVPLERIFPHNETQPTFRGEWREDLFYYFLSSMLVQIFAFTTLAPSNYLIATGRFDDLRQWVSNLPFIVQLIAIMALTDFVQYWVHRAFHRVPALWRFHAVHHSAQSMDWIAGARMHFHGNHRAARRHGHAGLCAWFHASSAANLSAHRLCLLHLRPCQPELETGLDGEAAGDATLSPLAPRH